jgi:hypothetical protein
MGVLDQDVSFGAHFRATSARTRVRIKRGDVDVLLFRQMRRSTPSRSALQLAVAPPDDEPSARNRNSPPKAIRPGEPLLLRKNAVLVHIDPFTFDSILETVGEQHAKGPIGIHHVLGIGDSYRHFVSIAFGDGLKRRRIFESTALDFADFKAEAHTDSLQIYDASRRIRSFVILEATLQPQTLVAATDWRAGLIDSATQGASLMSTIGPGRLA